MSTIDGKDSEGKKMGITWIEWKNKDNCGSTFRVNKTVMVFAKDRDCR